MERPPAKPYPYASPGTGPTGGAPPEEAFDSLVPVGRPTRWRLHLGLFVATVFSVFFTGAYSAAPPLEGDVTSAQVLLHTLKYIHTGWTFAVPLMAILLCHEFGHYFAAKWHGVRASLPFFIPMPLVSPFGTMGALISMPNRIKSRNALLDIGAAGPLAGMLVAIPVLVIGLMQSEVREVTGHGLMEGQCLLYLLIKRLVLGPIPAGHDVFLSPAAFAGWTGLLITMLNMLPIGQLDGGHIAWALFDDKQARFSRYARNILPLVFLYNVAMYREMGPGFVWIVWFGLLTLLKRLSAGHEHPPTEPGTLSPGRRWVAITCLVMFVLIFMPTPLRVY